MAIKGAANFYRRKKADTSSPAKPNTKRDLDTCRQLEREGFEVTYLAPQRNGIIDLKELEAAMRDDAVLLSIMHVNDEMAWCGYRGYRRNVPCRSHIYHVDATQSVAGKLPIDLSQLKVDLMSFSGHKIL
ncbi:aminotransferase class V-fold PLP-dependent enzyme [Shigella flexneri]